MNRTKTFVLTGLFAIGLAYGAGAEERDPAALARAMQGASATLEAGLQASEREGKPISGQIRDRTQ